MNSTKPIPLYPPSNLGISTIFVHVSTDGMCPSRNAIVVKLASLSHLRGSGYFYFVASFSHPFICFDLTPYGPNSRPIYNPRTSTAI